MLVKLLVFVIICFFAVASGSVRYRLQKEKPIMRPVFSQPRFAETWCSGKSNRNVLAQLAGARNLLWVVLTKDYLHVSPHFPFSLMFLPEAFGWDHRVPGKTIMEVSETSSDSTGRSVIVQYRHATGDKELLELRVSDVAALLQSLAEIRAQ